jgi:hypothetical protein
VRPVTVDRVSVAVEGLSPEEARRLERLVGELLEAPGAAPATGGGDPVDELARRIATGIADELRRHV